MEKRITVFVLFVLFLSSCSSDIMPACYRDAGNDVTVEKEVSFFDKINIDEGVELIIRQGVEPKVELVAGEHVIEEMEANVLDNTLYVKNKLQCSLGTVASVKARVTVPNLLKIYSSSQFNVTSVGVLNFPYLNLQQGLFGKTASNIFALEVNCIQLAVENNNTTIFRIKGATSRLNVAFYGGDARFEGAHLTAQDVVVFQRSSNDMIVKPMNNIEGDIYSNGNLILKNHPATVNVIQHYTGRIIYQ